MSLFSYQAGTSIGHFLKLSYQYGLGIGFWANFFTGMKEVNIRVVGRVSVNIIHLHHVKLSKMYLHLPGLSCK